MRGKTLSIIFIVLFLLLLPPITVSSFAGAQQEQTKTLYRLQGERIPFYQIAGLTIQKDTSLNQTIFVPQPSAVSLTEIEIQLGALSGILLSYFPGAVENPLRPIEEKWLGVDDPPIYLLNNQPVQIEGKVNPGYFVVVYPDRDNALRNVLQARRGVPREYQQTYRFVGFIEAQYIQPVQVEIPKPPDYTRVDPESLSQILLKKEEKATVVERNVVTAGLEDAQFFLNPQGWIEKVAKERGLTVEEIAEFKKLNSGLSLVVPGVSKLKLPVRKEEVPTQVAQAEQKAQAIVGEPWVIHDISDWARTVHQNVGVLQEKLDRPYDTQSAQPICVVVHDAANESRLTPVWDLMRYFATRSVSSQRVANTGYTYVIDEKGGIYRVQKDGYHTIHVNLDEINSRCIGVSATTTFNQDWLPWNNKQNEVMIKLVAYLAQKWNIDPTRTITFDKKYNGEIFGHFEYGDHADPVRYNPAETFREPEMDMDKFRQMIAQMPQVSEPTIIVYDENGNRVEAQAPTVQPQTPEPTLVPQNPDTKVANPGTAQPVSDESLYFSAYSYDEKILLQAFKDFMVNEFPRSPLRGYEEKIITEAKKQDVDVGFFIGNSAQGSWMGEYYIGQVAKKQTPGVHTNSDQGTPILVNSKTVDKNTYFRNVVDYTPDGVNLHQFDSWETMIEFWFGYIKNDYFSGKRFGKVLDTLETIQPIYCPPCERDNWWVNKVREYRGIFREYYNKLVQSDGESATEGFVYEPARVLMLHGVGAASGSITKANHEALLSQLMDRGYQFISVADLIDTFYAGKSLPKKWLLLTYDDGRSDFYTNAYPFLKKNNIPAVNFVPTQITGLTNAQIIEMQKSGLITIGAHTRTHPKSWDLVEMSDEKLRWEMEGSKEDLETIIGVPVLTIAYPGGGHNENVELVAKRIGFRLAFAVWGSKEGQSINDIFRLGRIDAGSNDIKATIAAIESNVKD